MEVYGWMVLKSFNLLHCDGLLEERIGNDLNYRPKVMCQSQMLELLPPFPVKSKNRYIYSFPLKNEQYNRVLEIGKPFTFFCHILD